MCMHAEARRQLGGVRSLYYVGPNDWTQVAKLDDKNLTCLADWSALRLSHSIIRHITQTDRKV